MGHERGEGFEGVGEGRRKREGGREKGKMRWSG